MDGIDSYHWNLARTFTGITTLVSLVGPFCNALIIITTIKTRSMRATCNILIAVCAVGDIFHQLGDRLSPLPFLLGYHLEISRRLCIPIMFLPEMGITIGCVCILLIGVDRMLSVLISMRYRAFNRFYYHIIHALLITGSCAYVSYLMVAHYQPGQVVCGILPPFSDGLSYFTFAILILNVSSAVVYLITWIGLRAYGDGIAMKRIVRSLIIIVTVDVCGWFLTPLFIHAIQHSDLDPQDKFVWSSFGPIFINIALSSKLFIYYFTSTEYRSAFKVLFGKKAIQFSSSASIQPSITIDRV